MLKTHHLFFLQVTLHQMRQKHQNSESHLQNVIIIFIFIRVFFLLHSSCLLNCYIPQGIRLQHIPGPIYGALKVWAWGFNYYELHGSLEFQEIHQTVKL